MIWVMWTWALAATLVVVVLFWLAYRFRVEHRFKLMAECASDLIALHQLSGKITWISPSCKDLLGYGSDELLGKYPSILFHPLDNQTQPALKQDGFRVVNRLRRKDGSYRWFETIAEPLMDRRGRVKQIRTSSRDITEQKRAQSLYRFTVNHIPNTTVLMYNRVGDLTVAEGHLCRSSQSPKNVSALFPADDCTALLSHLSKAFEKATASVELFLGNRIYLIHVVPVNGAGEGVELGMAVLRDITTEKNLNQALQVRSAALERSNHELEQFAHVASHEMKTPLRSIAGFSDILREEYQEALSPEAVSYLEHIVEGVGQLQEVINSLLLYSQVQIPKMNFEPVPLPVVLDEALKNLSPVIQTKSAKVVLETPLPVVHGQAHMLRQLFENLVDNGIKFNTTDRQPVIRIAAEPEQDNSLWHVSIQDNGPGLSNAYRDKVFQMFQRFNPEVPGTGIGLALCKKIVGTHTGRIWFTTTDSGTTFHFTLPAVPAEKTSVGGCYDNSRENPASSCGENRAELDLERTSITESYFRGSSGNQAGSGTGRGFRDSSADTTEEFAIASPNIA